MSFNQNKANNHKHPIKKVITKTVWQSCYQGKYSTNNTEWKMFSQLVTCWQWMINWTNEWIGIFKQQNMLQAHHMPTWEISLKK